MIELDFKKQGGLIPCIFQDVKTKRVLMLGYMNELAWQKTVETGKVHYWSRSRNKLWLKGESSGHTQKVHDIYVDCDNDTVLILGEQIGGAACHLGYESCFFQKVESDDIVTINEDKVFNPDDVYKK